MSVFQVCGDATENDRRASSVHTLGTAFSVSMATSSAESITVSLFYSLVQSQHHHHHHKIL